jgi:uncharacterized membrane protein YkgB
MGTNQRAITRRLFPLYQRIDLRITGVMGRFGIPLLRMSLGINFLWFGVLKFFEGMSPAQSLATRTMEQLTLGMLQPEIAIYILAVWETLIGLGLIAGRYLRVTLLLLFVQMLGTLTPLFLFPQETFAQMPYAPTLEGQYIIKNLVLISAGLVVGSTVRGGRIVSPSD